MEVSVEEEEKEEEIRKGIQCQEGMTMQSTCLQRVTGMVSNGSQCHDFDLEFVTLHRC